MPELPEVETIARGLRPLLEGNCIVRAEVWRPNVVVGPVRRFERALAGRTVERVGRRAKLLHFDLDGGDVWWTSLRMTGHYLVQPSEEEGGIARARSRPRTAASPGGRRRPPPDPFARARFDLASGERLYYVDVRTLGKLGVASRETWEERIAELGPEPLGPRFTADGLLRRLKRTRRRIKEVLLDQRAVSGIGNIYASEALFRAGIHPRARASDLSRPAVERLHAAVRDVLREAIRFQGTTFLNFAGTEGESGAFQERLRVYDRADESCLTCGGPLRRIVQAQRSTYYCPICQRRRR
ncbi:MAG: bifunctional DNA-formamidopyrimidine glycosylase/DNA-(apurinic or apyrimidinic site) lyase [Gemmatimonadota bacterium]